MKCIHICSDYANQNIYRELITHLDQKGIEQFVYIPVRREEEINGNRDDRLQNTSYRYSFLLRPLDRVLFRRKIRRVFNDLTSSVDVRQCSLVHAHYLFSDGAVALRLKKKFRIPYVVAVRNTDINYFMKFRPDLRYLAFKILREAHQIIFITPKYLDKMLISVPNSLREYIKTNSSIIPNGLSRYWLDNCREHGRGHQGPLRLLYVGDFSRNKNVTNILVATAILKEEMDVRLTLVGGGGNSEKKIEKMLASGLYDFVDKMGRISDIQKLKEIYRCNDVFVMPSFRETFGVAYLEALSQSLPVIYTRGQGIDGYFPPNSVGEAVDPKDPMDIKEKITTIVRHLGEMSSQCCNQLYRYDWTKIAETYVEIYKGATEKNT